MTDQFMNRKANKIIGIDLMGGDEPPLDFMDDLASFSQTLPQVHFIFLGSSSAKEKFNKLNKKDNLSFFLTKQDVTMDENPLHAVRLKKKSSISIGMHLLKEKKIDAFVSSGNTGALVGFAKTVLCTKPGISRPALLVLLPTKSDPVAVLDVGANVTCKYQHLVQFAELGADFQKMRQKKRPRIGLLNIGTEDKKGTTVLQKAYNELKKRSEKEDFEFLGNIEGREVFDGTVDVLVTDGFTGNVFLKTAEGTASYIFDQLFEKKFLEKNSKKQLDQLKHLHYGEYPGAILAGINGLVIKCHGLSTPKVFINAIKGAIEAASFFKI